MNNYKKEYGLTLQEAKQRSNKILGRLPLVGCEICVENGIKYVNGHYHKYKILLFNQSGKFFLRQWIDVNYTSATEYKNIPYGGIIE